MKVIHLVLFALLVACSSEAKVDDHCVPSCDGKTCGDDGCEGTCGTCAPGETCVEGACEDLYYTICIDNCEGLECGPDQCGGICGFCADGYYCDEGSCETGCVPDCAGKECGWDGCGGSCGAACEAGEVCTDQGVCEGCTPSCDDKECGDDGCGGLCGHDIGHDGLFSCQCGPSGECVEACEACDGVECPNTSLQDGTLAYWKQAGDVEVHQHFADTSPPVGEHMAVITNGLYSFNHALWDYEASNVNGLARSLCAPEDLERILFYWKLYTDGVDESCSGLSDVDMAVAAKVVVSGDSPPDEEGHIFHVSQTVSAGTVELGLEQVCAEIGLEKPNFSFGGGQVWTTSWQKVELDLEGQLEPILQELADESYTVSSIWGTLDFRLVSFEDEPEHSTVLLVAGIQLIGKSGCTLDSDCIADNACITGTCEDGACTYTDLPGCCLVDADCEDDDDCTETFCQQGVCLEKFVCCIADDECDDDDPCTVDTCVDALCVHEASEGCCDGPEDCDDADPCTVDTCESAWCKHTPDPSCSFCGDGVCGPDELETCPQECSPVPDGCKPNAAEVEDEPIGTEPIVFTGLAPGCDGCDCEACVCDIRPWCCEEGWDLECATICKELCGSCGGPSGCGNGSCQQGESCASCPEDCGSCPPEEYCGDGVCHPWDEDCWSANCALDCGTCDGCLISDLPTCGGCSCEECVCAQDPSCCSDAWTLTCVFLCTGCSGGCDDTTCGNGICNGGNQPDEGEDAATCPEDCGFCGDGSCLGWESEATCPEDCGYCGDGYCATGETEWSCSSDCLVTSE